MLWFHVKCNVPFLLLAKEKNYQAHLSALLLSLRWSTLLEAARKMSIKCKADFKGQKNIKRENRMQENRGYDDVIKIIKKKGRVLSGLS